MRNLEKMQNRRKAVIYISSGYDFNPFEDRASRSRRGACTRWHGRQRQRDVRCDSTDRSVLSHAAEQPVAGRSRPGARARRADARGQPRQRDDLHDRPARPGGRPGPRRRGAHAGVERVRARLAGQPARAGRGDRRHRRRQPERLRQGAEAHRRRDERLLRARVLLVATRTR